MKKSFIMYGIYVKPSPVLMVETLLVHLDLTFALTLEPRDLLSSAADEEAHHGVRNQDLFRSGLDAPAHNIS